MALLKATHGTALDSTGIRFNTIITLAQKETALTANEVAILEHFVHSNNTVLNNTVYINDQIIHPVSHSHKTYYKRVNGQFAERKPGSGQHMAAKAAANPKQSYIITGRRPGRPRKNP
jgi:hypothetical protein